MKQLKVKLKTTVTQPTGDEVLASRWERLSEFLRVLYGVHTSSTPGSSLRGWSYEELYSGVVDVCSQGKSSELFSRLSGSMESRVSSLLEGLPTGVPSSEGGGVFLARMRGAWGVYCSELSLQSSIFQHLDRSYLAAQPGNRCLLDVGVAAWGVQLAGRFSPLLGLLATSMCREVERERRGEGVDRGVMGAITAMLTSVSLVSAHLHEPLLEGTRDFFEAEGTSLSSSLPVPTYLAHVEGRLKEESDRVHSYLELDGGGRGGGGTPASSSSSSSSRVTLLSQVISRVEDSLITRHVGTILMGLAPLLSAGSLSDLKRMYQLLLRVKRVDSLKTHFSDYSKTTEIVGKGEEEKDKVMVQSLLEFKDAMSAAVATSFGGNATLTQCLRNALEGCINARQDRPAELIAKYVDAKMRVVASGAGWEAEVEGAMEKVMQLFRCIHGKDVFEAFYKKDLAKRLLLGRSSSTDLEKAMVGKLKSECGAAFTSKLECMFKDVELSRELNGEFSGGGGAATAAAAAAAAAGAAAAGAPSSSSGGGGQTGGGIDLYVNILTASHWPTYPQSPDILLPQDMSATLRAFEAFFTTKHASRKLAWVPHVSTCVLRAHLGGVRKDFDVSQHQALVLLLFASSDGPITASAIRAATGIEREELKRTLQSLALGQVRVLRKEPKGREVEDGDAFTLNTSFSHPLTRIKINQIQVKETRAEADATNERVFQDRQYQVDAAIVRIMKARKVLAHQMLMGELLSQLRFACEAGDIKKRIESLIERDYLERDVGDNTQYRYVA